jgi:hypothetical protein
VRTYPSIGPARRALHAEFLVRAERGHFGPGGQGRSARESGRQAAVVASCLGQMFPAGTVRIAVLGDTAVPEERTVVPGKHTAVPGEHTAVPGRTAADHLAFLAACGVHAWAARPLEVSWAALEDLHTAKPLQAAAVAVLYPRAGLTSSNVRTREWSPIASETGKPQLPQRDF